VDKCFANVELIAMKTMEQPTLDERNIKSTKTLTPLEVLPQTKGNELNRPFIHFFCCFVLFLFSLLFFLLFFQMEKRNIKGTSS